MGNNHHEDERYRKYYDGPPHGEVPQDPKLRAAREAGLPADDDSATDEPTTNVDTRPAGA
ncbi:MAG: hypothetical protein ABWX68_11010 [Arthrobacter sp.]|uniref:hypothetical protein n=1 Tax=Arthrobacter sp. TaxID=1667 RepID=UPI0034843016